VSKTPWRRFSELNPFAEKYTSYEVHVEAFNSMGVSEKTDPHFATTLEDGKEGFKAAKYRMLQISTSTGRDKKKFVIASSVNVNLRDWPSQFSAT
jgi:hypothetical protein